MFSSILSGRGEGTYFILLEKSSEKVLIRARVLNRENTVTQAEQR